MNALAPCEGGKSPDGLHIATAAVTVVDPLSPLDVHVHPIEAGFDQGIEGLRRHQTVGDEAAVEALGLGKGEEIEAELKQQGGLVEGDADAAVLPSEFQDLCGGEGRPVALRREAAGEMMVLAPSTAKVTGPGGYGQGGGPRVVVEEGRYLYGARLHGR